MTLLNNLKANLKRVVPRISQEDHDDPLTICYSIDIDQSEKCGDSYQKQKCNTLTKQRALVNGFWISSRSTRMSTSEMLRLQGFPVNRFLKPSGKATKVTIRQFHGMIGNAMTLSVLYRITRNLLIATKKIDGDIVQDQVEKLGYIPWIFAKKPCMMT